MIFAKETRNCILEIRGNFPTERNSAQGPRNEIWSKTGFLSNVYIFLFFYLFFIYLFIFFEKKMLNIGIDRYYSLFLKGFEDCS